MKWVKKPCFVIGFVINVSCFWRACRREKCLHKTSVCLNSIDVPNAVKNHSAESETMCSVLLWTSAATQNVGNTGQYDTTLVRHWTPIAARTITRAQRIQYNLKLNVFAQCWLQKFCLVSHDTDRTTNCPLNVQQSGVKL